ncbi:MAG: oligosaccharide flippase family protein [Candidatus Lokiarchaeota archaeon]|nr:oligosaccharide flippase family protein [Candidatus Lokiarchaeota archaeon]
MKKQIIETVQHTGIFSLGAILRQGASYFLLPIYTNYLSVADYGYLNLLLILNTTMAALSGTTIGPALIRSYYDYDNTAERARALGTAMLLAIFLSLSLGAVGLVFAGHLAELLVGSTGFASEVRVVLCIGFANSIMTVAAAIIRAKKWSRKYLLVNVLAMLAQVGAIIYFLIIRHYGISGVIYGIGSGTALGTVLMIFLVRNEFTLGFSWEEAKRMLFFGAPFLPTNAIAIARKAGIRLILAHSLGATAVGIYALAFRIGNFVQLLIGRPFSQISPAIVMSALSKPRATRFYARLLSYLTAALLLLAISVSVSAGPVLRAMSKQEYWEAIRLVPLIAFGIALFWMRGLLGIGAFIKRKTYWFPVRRAAGSIIFLGMSLILVQEIGVIAVGYSFIAGSLATCVVGYFTTRSLFPVQFEWLRLARLFAAGAVSFMAASLLSSDLWVLELILRNIAVLLAFIATLVILRFFEPDEKSYIRQRTNLILSKLRM